MKNDDLLNLLLETSNKHLSISTDQYGQNLLGICLMEIRIKISLI